MKQKMLIEEKIIAVLMCIMVLMVAVQVLSRYVVHTSISYTEEIVRYFFVWATFLGASAATYKKKHLSVAASFKIIPDRMVKLFEKKFDQLIKYSTGIAALIFSSLLTLYGLKIIHLQIKTGQTTAALGFPMWIIGLAVPVCSIVMIVRLVMLALGKGGRV